MRDGPLDLSHVRRALVIDDEGAVRSVLRRWLKRRGWEVSEALDGGEALAKMQEPVGAGAAGAPDFDVIICDLRMPTLSGPELHAWTKTHRPDLTTRLVFASGDVQEPEAAQFLQQCGCPVLEKPFELSRLEALLSSFDPKV